MEIVPYTHCSVRLEIIIIIIIILSQENKVTFFGLYLDSTGFYFANALTEYLGF